MGCKRKKEKPSQAEIMMAKLAREQWETYKRIGIPLENAEIEYAKDLGTAEERDQTIRQSVNSAREVLQAPRGRPVAQPGGGRFLGNIVSRESAVGRALSRAQAAGVGLHDEKRLLATTGALKIGRGISVDASSQMARSLGWEAGVNSANVDAKNTSVEGLYNLAGTVIGGAGAGYMYGRTNAAVTPPPATPGGTPPFASGVTGHDPYSQAYARNYSFMRTG